MRKRWNAGKRLKRLMVLDRQFSNIPEVILRMIVECLLGNTTVSNKLFSHPKR